MRILIVTDLIIPCLEYGGIERMVWWLGKELVKLGHTVSFLAAKDSTCHFAKIKTFDPSINLDDQIPDDIDVVHIHLPLNEEITKKPYLFTAHAITEKGDTFDKNYVFVSKEHARLNGSTTYVYHGIDPDDYGTPLLTNKRDYFHFLGRAAKRFKNVKGAIKITKLANEKLEVIGGDRWQLKMGPRFTLDQHVRFRGILGGAEKNKAINGSKGLIHPVRCYESFGIALIESLYFGCPVFGTTYGALKELIIPEVGALSNSATELSELIKQSEDYKRKDCYEYVCDNFLSEHMAENYVKLYGKVVNGETLNKEKPVSISSIKPFLPFYP